MAMDKDRLGAALTTAVASLTSPAPAGSDLTQLTTLMTKIADEIIKEIVGFADVSVDTPGVAAGAATRTGTGGVVA